MDRVGLLKVFIAAVIAGWSSGVAAESGQGAMVTVKVMFAGAAPPSRPVDFGAEKQCAVIHKDQPSVYEDVVVNGNGTLKNVLVYVAGELPGEFAAPTEPFVFNQKGCIFAPHVGAVMVGQPVEIRNDDPLLHNVRAQSKLGQSFNIAQPVQGMKTTKTMKKQEIGVPLKCDVHFWMTAYLHVLSHPFFGVTSDDGTVSIQHLPAGTYTFEAWHEKLSTQLRTITVQNGETKMVEFVFKGL